jgi:hypothetical protein
MLRGVKLFQKIHAIGGDIRQFTLFVRSFYDFEFPLFYNHRNREGNVIIIRFVMETHQGDLVRTTLFA